MVAFIGVVVLLLVVGLGLAWWRARSRRAASAPVEEPAKRAEVVAAPEPVEVAPERLPYKHSSGLLRQVKDADIELEIRAGRVLNAIRLYREQTGADVHEARSAVEAWRTRLTAS